MCAYGRLRINGQVFRVEMGYGGTRIYPKKPYVSDLNEETIVFRTGGGSFYSPDEDSRESLCEKDRQDLRAILGSVSQDDLADAIIDFLATAWEG